jgi:hypothetical protein
MQQVKINLKFCVNGAQREQVAAKEREFPIYDLMENKGLHANQLRNIYQQCIGEGNWKYETADAILSIIGSRRQHTLVAMGGDAVVGTVRSVFLPHANFVYGSCLAVEKEHRGNKLYIPLIMAAMTVANEHSLEEGSSGIKGAFLGVDDSPVMRRMHAAWGVRYIDHRHLPLIVPPFHGISDHEQIRSFGIRFDQRDFLLRNEFLDIAKDLTAFEVAIGYDEGRAFKKNFVYVETLAEKERVELIDARNYERVN